MSLLFYTAADEEYEHYAPIFIYFALRATPDSYVEVGLEDADRYKKENIGAVQTLREEFGSRFKLSTVDFEGIPPGAVRFISEPSLSDTCDYVYICDIDILILDDDIKQKHLENMSQNDIPFSNNIRRAEDTEDNYYRLTGLHFAPTNIQYPIPDISDLDLLSDDPPDWADEHILYQIMNIKGKMIPHDMYYRPVHGIHMRSYSNPFGIRPGWRGPEFSFESISDGEQRVSWTGIESEEYREEFLMALQEPVFQELFFQLDVRARNQLMILENACRGRFEEFEQEAMTYIVSEYLNKTLIRKKLSRTIVGRIYRAFKRR